MIRKIIATLLLPDIIILIFAMDFVLCSYLRLHADWLKRYVLRRTGGRTGSRWRNM